MRKPPKDRKEQGSTLKPILDSLIKPRQLYWAACASTFSAALTKSSESRTEIARKVSAHFNVRAIRQPELIVPTRQRV
jgi:hypothetical protein